MAVTTGQKLSRFASRLDDEGDNVTFTVDTLAELKGAASGMSVGDERRVKGRTSYYDGYQGTFIKTDTDYSALAALDTTNALFIDNGDGTYLRRKEAYEIGSSPVVICGWAGITKDSSASENSNAIESLNSLLNAMGGGTIFFPGVNVSGGEFYAIARAISPLSFVSFEGVGKNSYIRNTTTSGSSGGELAVITPGNYKASGQVGGNIMGVSNYAIDPVDVETDNMHQVTLTTSGDAANFQAGQIVFLWSDTFTSDGRVSAYQQINKVTAVNAGTGVITLNRPLYKSLSDGNIGIDGTNGVVDWNNNQSKVWERGTFKNLAVGVAGDDSWVRLGAMYECEFSDVHVYETNNSFAMNGAAYSVIKNITGQFNSKAINLAYFSHNTLVTGINQSQGPDEDATASNSILVQWEENAHHLRYENFILDIGGEYDIDQLIKVSKAGEHNVIDGVTLNAPNTMVDNLIAWAWQESVVTGLPKHYNTIRNINANVRAYQGDLVQVADQLPNESLSHNITENIVVNGQSFATGDIVEVSGSGYTFRNFSGDLGNRVVQAAAVTLGGNIIEDIHTTADEIGVLKNTAPIELKNLRGKSWIGLQQAEFVDTTTGVVSETSVDNVIDSVTIPGGSLIAGDSIEAVFAGRIQGSTGQKFTKIIIENNGNSVSVDITHASGYQDGFFIDAEITIQNSTTIRIAYKASGASVSTDWAVINSVDLDSDTTVSFIGYVANAADRVHPYQMRTTPRRLYG